ELIITSLDAQQRADARLKLSWVGRLLEVVVGAGFDSLQPPFLLTLDRNHNNRNLPGGRVAFERIADCVAIYIGQLDIKDDQVGLPARDRAKGCVPIDNQLDRVVGELQELSQRRA